MKRQKGGKGGEEAVPAGGGMVGAEEKGTKAGCVANIKGDWRRRLDQVALEGIDLRPPNDVRDGFSSGLYTPPAAGERNHDGRVGLG